MPFCIFITIFYVINKYELKNELVIFWNIGIKKIKGPFKRGDSVAIQFKNKTFAYGLCDYDSKDISKIMGKKSFEIEEVLGFLISDVVIHRDNMILK